MPPGQPAAIPVSPSPSVWERISSWASENKAVVYTIAGVAVVVTGAGVVYYLNSDSVCTLIPYPPLLLCCSTTMPKAGLPGMSKLFWLTDVAILESGSDAQA